jgi:hypothetical protein
VSVVTSRQEISEFYQHLTEPGRDVAAPHRLLSGWRGHALGDVLRRLIEGKGKITLQWEKEGLQALGFEGDS